MLKQRLDFPLEKRIETTDRLPAIEGQKILETRVRFSIWQKNLNDEEIAYNAKPKKVLKQRLDFLFKNELRERIDC